MQKTIYSLAPLREVLVAANRRYLAFLSDLSDPTAGVRQIAHVAEPTRQDARSYRGFNLFGADDLALFTALARGEWQISGFRNSSLRRVLPHYSGPQLSRLLKRFKAFAPSFASSSSSGTSFGDQSTESLQYFCLFLMNSRQSSGGRIPRGDSVDDSFRAAFRNRAPAKWLDGYPRSGNAVARDTQVGGAGSSGGGRL